MKKLIAIAVVHGLFGLGAAIGIHLDSQTINACGPVYVAAWALVGVLIHLPAVAREISALEKATGITDADLQAFAGVVRNEVAAQLAPKASPAKDPGQAGFGTLHALAVLVSIAALLMWPSVWLFVLMLAVCAGMVLRPRAVLAGVALVALAGCAEWQAGATAVNSYAVGAAHNTVDDALVGESELLCGTPYSAVIRNTAKLPGLPTALKSLCGDIPAGSIPGSLAPSALGLLQSSQKQPAFAPAASAPATSNTGTAQ